MVHWMQMYFMYADFTSFFLSVFFACLYKCQRQYILVSGINLLGFTVSCLMMVCCLKSILIVLLDLVRLVS